LKWFLTTLLMAASVTPVLAVDPGLPPQPLAEIPVKEPLALPTNVGWGRCAESILLYLTPGWSPNRIKTNATGYHLPTE